jgi:hypothetical protein
MRWLGAVLVLFALFTLSSVSMAWYDANYDYRRPVNITGNTIDLINYVANISLDTASLITAGKMREDCYDIRMVDSDDSSTLWYNVTNCNASDTHIRFNVDLTANTTKTIYVYYDYPSATDGSRVNIYPYYVDENTIALYHMENLSDETGNYDLLNGDGVTLNDFCLFGSCYEFTGNYLYSVTLLDAVPENGTIELWYNSSYVAEYKALFGKRNNETDFFTVYFDDYSGKARMDGQINGEWISPFSNGCDRPDIMRETGVWNHIALSWGTQGIKYYGNDLLLCQNETLTSFIADGSYMDFIIGNDDSLGSAWWYGAIDEIRVSDKQRDPTEFGYSNTTELSLLEEEPQIPTTTIDNCTSLDETGMTYLLTQDLMNWTGYMYGDYGDTYVCFDITSNNTVLDCQGHTLWSENTQQTSITAVYGELSNITVKNCIIISDSILKNTGIVFGGVRGGTIDNVSIEALTGIDSSQNNIRYSWNTLVTNSKISKCAWGILADATGITEPNLAIMIDNVTINCDYEFPPVVDVFVMEGNFILKNSILYGQNLTSFVFIDANATEFYNNFINESEGVMGSHYIENAYGDFNVTRQSGTRIYSAGTEIGGNYWANMNGTGYSEICEDTDTDGFCDEPYTASPTDYLPYSDEYSPPTTTTIPAGEGLGQAYPILIFLPIVVIAGIIILIINMFYRADTINAYEFVEKMLLAMIAIALLVILVSMLTMIV